MIRQNEDVCVLFNKLFRAEIQQISLSAICTTIPFNFTGRVKDFPSLDRTATSNKET